MLSNCGSPRKFKVLEAVGSNPFLFFFNYHSVIFVSLQAALLTLPEFLAALIALDEA